MGFDEEEAAGNSGTIERRNTQRQKENDEKGEIEGKTGRQQQKEKNYERHAVGMKGERKQNEREKKKKGRTTYPSPLKKVIRVNE